MDLSEFGSVFGVLSLQLRALDTDEATVRAYYEVLQKFPLDSIQRSARMFAQERDRKFFPTTAEWATAAERVFENTARQKLLSEREKPWQMECESCDDTGWLILDCPDQDCGRRHSHSPHTWARPCPCRASNRTYQRHHQVGRTAQE